MTQMGIGRRRVLGLCAGLFATPLVWPQSAVAAAAPTTLNTSLLARAQRAAQRHRSAMRPSSAMAVVDFSAPSFAPRLHLVDLAGGGATAMLVAHGRGSDPAHTGWARRLSNDPGSHASSSGAYLVDEIYFGRHGRSRRLVGLDPENSNAEARGIVIHAAPYVSSAIAETHGKLGRSEGCFALSAADIGHVLDVLSPGSLLYASPL